MLEYIVFSIINSLLFGMLLFMLSSGLTLIFSMMGVLNFAHASFFMLGAYFAFQISKFIGFWPALVITPLLVGVLGALVERYGLLRSVHEYGHVAELLFAGRDWPISSKKVVNLISGAERRNVQKIPAILDFPYYPFQYRFFGLSDLYAGHFGKYVRGPVPGLNPHPHRAEYPGGPDPPRTG